MTTPRLFAPIESDETRRVQRLSQAIQKRTKPKLRPRAPAADVRPSPFNLDEHPNVAVSPFASQEPKQPPASTTGLGSTVDILSSIGGGALEFARTAFAGTLGREPEPGSPRIGPLSLRTTGERGDIGEPLPLPGARAGRQFGEAITEPITVDEAANPLIAAGLAFPPASPLIGPIRPGLQVAGAGARNVARPVIQGAGRAADTALSAGARGLERVSPARPVRAAGDEAEGAARLFDDISEAPPPTSPRAAAAVDAPAGTPPPAADVPPPPSGRPPTAVGGPPELPPEGGDSVSKMTELMRAAKPVRAETEALKSAELRQRAGVLASAQRGAKGEQAVLRTRAALKGELPKAQFDPPSVGLTQADRDELFDIVNQSDKLRPLEKVGAADALLKAVNGQVPTIGEIATLEKVFGADFAKALLAKRPLNEKFWEEVIGAANLPRAVVSSYDLSAPLRQGSWFSTSRPKEFVSAFKAQVRSLRSEEVARAIDDAIRTRPNADLAEDAGLYLAPRGVADLSAREEAFMSKLAEKIPGVEISQRAYVTFLNKLRSEVFDTVYDGWIREGRRVTKTDIEELARYINVATGRGSLPAFMSKGNRGAILNALFFSPRFVTSRFEIARSLLSPSAPVRKQAWRDFGLYVGPRATVLGLGAAAGLWAVETDPRSSDFGKVRIGNVRVDPWGGWQPVIRYMAQLVTNRRKVLKTGEIAPVGLGERDWLDGASRTLLRFGRSKLSPPAGAVADVAAGRTFVGDDVTVLGTARRLVTPLIVDSVMEANSEVGLFWAIPLAIVEGLGAGVQAFDATESPGQPSSPKPKPSLKPKPKLKPRLKPRLVPAGSR